MKKVVFLEGGSDQRELTRRKCREGFRRLLEKAGFAGRMPRLVASGGRSKALLEFRHELKHNAQGATLWVDSEVPVHDAEQPWEALKAGETKLERPDGAGNDHLLLMTTCMEALLAADVAALEKYFEKGLRKNALPQSSQLENVGKEDLLKALRNATNDCQTKYGKGEVSFELLGTLNIDVLTKRLPSFARAIRVLNQRL